MVLAVGLIGLAPMVSPAQVGGMGVIPRGAVPPRVSASFHPDSSYTAETLLRNASNQIKAQQWSEAIDLYLRVIKEHGESVALVPPSDRAEDAPGETLLYVDARRYCQSRIASLPREALVIYRQRVDAQAEPLYKQGVDKGDQEALQRVVNEMFCSSVGDEAADLLGDLHFRDGRFSEALAAYRRLVPDGPTGPSSLVYPDPDVDLARVAAKKLLCLAAMDEGSVGEAEIAAFRKAYPDAKGRLTGRSGSLADAVEEAARADHLAMPESVDGRWPTFAGSASRSRVVADPVDVGDLQWSLPLSRSGSSTEENPAMRRQMGFQNEDPEPATYPIVLGDLAVICDEDGITAFHMNVRPSAGNAQEVTEQVLAWRSPLPTPRTSRSTRIPGATPRYSLSASGDRIFARLGSPGRGGGTLVAVRNNRDVEGKLLWFRQAHEIELPRRANEPDRLEAAYEGTPVADADRVYIALTEAATETWVYVACLDAETGRTIWVRYLGNASSAFDQMRQTTLGTEMGQRLLTLDGQTVYYQTNMGALAALDADTGAVRWLSTYPTPDQNPTEPLHRGLNPAIAHGGFVIVAPDDAPEIFAFDSASGELVWKTEPIAEIKHLLGVAQGHLFATGNHLFTFDVKTGRLARPAWPEVGGFEGFGRGLLAGDKVYCPTRTEILVLDQKTGGRVHETIPLFQAFFDHEGGNLAVGDGYLVVAERGRLAVYCQNSRLIERYQELIVEQPERASNHFQLARLAEATGRTELALESLENASKLARPGDLVDGQPLASVAQARAHGLLMKLARELREKKDFASASDLYARAVSTALTDRERLTARLEQGEAQAQAGQPERAVENLQTLLADERLNDLTVAADERRTLRAELLIADRLCALVREHGPSLYAPFDRKAETLLAEGLRREDARLLREVGQSYPASKVAPEALLALARLSESDGRHVEAASAYKRLLAISAGNPADPDRAQALQARALWGLAQAYESQGLLGAARDTFSRAEARFPAVELDAFGLKGTVGQLVQAKLASEPFQNLGGGGAEPSVPLPLNRLWDRRFSGDVRPLTAEGLRPSEHAGRLFVAEGDSLRPIDPASGESAWSADLGGEPVWVGYQGKRVLAASARRLDALDLGTGEVLWSFDPADPRGVRHRLDPFARPNPGGSGPPSDAVGRLHAFHLLGARLYMLRGDQEFYALDTETGQLDWSYSPAEGGINPHVLISSARVVLQAGPGRRLVVLDADNGRSRGEYRVGSGRPPAPWMRDPVPIDDDRLALAVDARTITLFDLEKGAEVWTYHDDSELPRTQGPRLLSDSGRLLALFDGHTLVRLNPASGLPLWERGLCLGDLSESPEALAVDADHVYCAYDSTLTAYRLDTGEPAWRRHLVGPESAGWSLALTERFVVAYPDPTRSLGGVIDSLPVVLCRRQDGLPVQRLVFHVPASVSAVRLDPGSVVVATQGRVWALGAAVDTAP
jgi:outer membrane protein assembly factor BamB